MHLGIDLGGSAVKVVGMDGERLLFSHCENNSARGAARILTDVLGQEGCRIGDVRGIVATGLGAERCDVDTLGVPVKRMVELGAIGRGATFLSGINKTVIANTGTGTSFIRAENGEYTHLCGTGVGGGTIVGLGKGILGITNVLDLDRIARRGDLHQVDLTVGDLCSGAGSTLPPDLTAANLAKVTRDADADDWAAGILNLVTQVIGTMCVMCAQGSGMDTVVITGALASLPFAIDCYKFFEQMYGYKFILPENGRYATAVGAVLTGEDNAWF